MYGELNLLFCIFKVAPLFISIGNLLLIIIILFFYWSRTRVMKLRFNSMALFFTFFLIQNLLFAAYFVLNIPNNFNDLIAPIIFLGFECAALLILLRVTWNEA